MNARPGTRLASGLLALALTSLASLSAGCGSSPTESEDAYAVVVGGGLVNTSRGNTIEQFKAEIDGQQVQLTSYSTARNLGELNVRATVKGPKAHVLELSVPRQTVASADYTSYAIVIVVSDMKGNIVYQGTPSDKTMRGMTTASKLPISFGW